MAHSNIAELRLTRNDTLELAKIFKCMLERLSNETVDILAKNECLDALGIFLNSGYEAAKLNGGLYFEHYQKHFSSFLRLACFEGRSNSLAVVPISELAQSLIEMLAIAISCFAKAGVDSSHPNYKDFAGAFRRMMGGAVVPGAGLGAASAKLCDMILCE